MGRAVITRTGEGKQWPEGVHVGKIRVWQVARYSKEEWI